MSSVAITISPPATLMIIITTIIFADVFTKPLIENVRT